jgi:hypothetical protein
MHPTPEQSLAERLDKIASFVDGQTVQARSLVIIVQRWHAPTLIQVLREVLRGITHEQAMGWCSRLTRTMVRIGPATMARKGENAACAPGLIGACLVRDEAVDQFVRPLPPFRGSVAQSGLSGLSVAPAAGHAADGSSSRRSLWLDLTDDDLARSVVDISHVLAESALLMNDPIDVTLDISGGPLPDALGKEIIYRRAVMQQDRSLCAYRAIMWVREGA